MAQRTSRKDDTGLTVAVGAAFASILGNIAQAIENTEVKRQAHSLAQQRSRLLKVLSEWQAAFGEQRLELEACRNDLRVAFAKERHRQRELDRLRAENAKLSRSVAELEAQAATTASKEAAGASS